MATACLQAEMETFFIGGYAFRGLDLRPSHALTYNEQLLAAKTVIGQFLYFHVQNRSRFSYVIAHVFLHEFFFFIKSRLFFGR